MRGVVLNRAVPASTFWLSAIAGCVALMLLPAYAGRGSAVIMRFKYKVGDAYTYQTSGQIGVAMTNIGGSKGAPSKRAGQPGGMLKLPVNSTQAVKVVKLESNGNARLEITSSSSSPMGGQPGGMPVLTTHSFTATPLGVLTGANAAKQAGGLEALAAMGEVGTFWSITAYLPTKPVSPGDIWTQKVGVPQMSAMATITGVFEKLSQVGRYKTAHIKLTVILPVNSKVDVAAATKGKVQGESSLSGTITMHYEDDFAIAEGRLIKSIGTGSTDIIIKQRGSANAGAPSAAKPISVKLTITSTLVQ